MFNKPNPKQDFSELDEAVSKWWDENRIFEKSINNRDGKDNYVFYDGPPFMSGMPHYAHLLSSIAKDIIPRYHSMKGKRVERVWGWDTHGLPIENKVEDQLNLEGRKAILEYGLDRFIEKCYEWNRVGIEKWRWYVRKIGRWADIDNAYRTMDQSYMESVWWGFKTMWDKGLVYKGLRTSMYSTDSSTPVSDFEVSMDADNYRDTEDIAIYVKFQINEPEKLEVSLKDKRVYALAWTTTPWTIPANFALAVNPEAAYVLVEYRDDLLIMAKDLHAEILKENYTVVKELTSNDLTGLSYQQIYNFLKGGENDFKIYQSDYVTISDGTGILHVAPAFGEADFEMGQKWNLSFKSNIDDAGNLTVGEWKGTYLRNANKSIADDLESKSVLLRQEKYMHRLPYYRYDNPLIYKTEENYFVNIQKLKQQLVKSNDDINWVPDYFKDGRFKYILDNAPDWSISRSRFWGTAMPLWESEDGSQVVIGSREELMKLVNESNDENKMQKVILKLDNDDKHTSQQIIDQVTPSLNNKDTEIKISTTQENLAVLRFKLLGETDEESKVKPIRSDESRVYFLFNGKPLDLHRPYIDEIKFEKDGKLYKRNEFTLDVWMDSGSMPFAQFGYPLDRKEHFELNFPGDYISEYTGQIRAWFYVLHVISNAIFDSNAFKNVLVTGVMSGEDGRKMSKSFGNYPDPKKTLEKYGGDALRLYFAGSKIMYGGDTDFSEKELKLQVQEIILPVWNIYSYFTTYANLNNWTPSPELAYNQRNVTEDSHPWDHIPFDGISNNLDAWILFRLQETIVKAGEALDQFTIAKATTAIKDLIDDLSKWYIRSNRGRFIDGDTRAIETLYYVLVETIKLMAPFTPFLSEHIYQELVVGHIKEMPESIHLTDYPETDKKFIEEYQVLMKEMEVVRKIVEIGHTLRVENSQKVRQPLRALYYKTSNQTVPHLTNWMTELLMNELNVMEVSEKATIENSETIKVIIDDSIGFTIGLNIELDEELESMGLIREIGRQIQSQRKKINLQMGDKINLSVFGPEKLVSVMLNKKDDLMIAVNANEIVETEKGEDWVELNVNGESLFVKMVVQ